LLNDKQLTSIAELFGFFQVIEFIQKDNEIIMGGPDIRRRFFDICCSLDSRIYYKNFLNYNRALKQRNNQIKNDLLQKKNNRSLWDAALVEYGVQLIQSRKKITENLVMIFNNYFKDIFGSRFEISIEYKTNAYLEGIDLHTSFLQKLRGSIAKENIFKTTVIGPHRDDFLFYNYKKNMKHFSSQGEIRLAVIMLKMALVEYLSKFKNKFPILLLDDILLEIDNINMAKILEIIKNRNQVFFTSTEVPNLDFFKGLDQTNFYNICLSRVE